MPVIYPTSRIYFEDKAAGSIFKNDEQVWPPTEAPPDTEFSPLDLPNCTVWIDATQLGLADGAAVSPWPNLGSGGAGTIVGTPAPVLKANTLFGNPVVRFKINEGRIRGTGMCVDGSFDLTLFHVTRRWGPNLGRSFSNVYPPYNFLVGHHSGGGEQIMYDNGWVGSVGLTDPTPGPWRLYEAVCNGGTSKNSKLYIDGVFKGEANTSAGHGTGWNISGYDAAGTQETMDCEVAEFIAYNRTLTDPERVQVESYLGGRWFAQPDPS